MLDKYRDFFKSFGGHSAACGFTVSASKVEALKNGLNNDLANMLKEDEKLLDVRYDYDAEIKASDVSLGLARALNLLEPCGKGNEVPTFLIESAEVSNWKYLKNDNKMARFSINSEDGSKADAIISSGASEAYDAVCAGRVDILGSVDINNWRDEEKVQFIARHIMPEKSVK